MYLCLHLYFYKIFKNNLLLSTVWVNKQKVWQWVDFMVLLVIVKYFPIAQHSKLKFPALVFKVLDQLSVSSPVLMVFFQWVPKSPEKDHLGHVVNIHEGSESHWDPWIRFSRVGPLSALMLPSTFVSSWIPLVSFRLITFMPEIVQLN